MSRITIIILKNTLIFNFRVFKFIFSYSIVYGLDFVPLPEIYSISLFNTIEGLILLVFWTNVVPIWQGISKEDSAIS